MIDERLGRGERARGAARSDDGGAEIVKGVTLNDLVKAKIAETVAELEKERDLVKDLLATL